MKRIFLDADIIISAFDEGAKGRTQQRIDESKAKINMWLEDADTTLYTGSLVKYEVLRGVSAHAHPERYQNIETFINLLEVLDLSQKDSDLAIQIWHQALNDRLFKPDSKSFDILHFAVTKNNELEMVSDNLKDMQNINGAYETLMGKNRK